MTEVREPEGGSGEFRSAHAYVLVLQILSKHRWIGLAEIQKRLADEGVEYGRRWLEKVLKHLVDDRGLVERDDSERPYVFRWRQDLHNPWGPDLSDRESLTLLLAAEHLRHLLPVEVLQWMEARFHEARTRLHPLYGKGPFNSWPQKVAVVSQLPAFLPPKVSPEVLDRVSEALLNDQWLAVDYRNAAGNELRGRRVMPLALVQQSERLFLVCRFEGYDDVRNLALHRILVAEPPIHRFERPSDFKLKEYIANGGFGFGNGERIQLELRVAPHLAELLVETPLAEDQVIKEVDDGWMCLRATVLRCEQIRWWIRMQGRAVEVVKPWGFLSESDSELPLRTPLKE